MVWILPPDDGHVPLMQPGQDPMIEVDLAAVKVT
jgi:hypothetical protein